MWQVFSALSLKFLPSCRCVDVCVWVYDKLFRWHGKTYFTNNDAFNIFPITIYICFYLRNRWAVVEPLVVPGCPSSCFRPLLRTVLRPFLLTCTTSGSPPKSLCLWPLSLFFPLPPAAGLHQAKMESTQNTASRSNMIPPPCLVDVKSLHTHRHTQTERERTRDMLAQTPSVTLEAGGFVS